MKKLFKTLVVLTMASATVITSCKKDESTIEDVKVTVLASPSATTLDQGTSLNLTLQFAGNDDNKLQHVTVTANKLSTPALDKDLSGTSATEVVTVSLDQAGTWSFQISVQGKGKTAAVVATYEVTVKAPSVFNIESDNVTLGNQADGTPIFWASTTKATSKLSDVKATPSLAANIDFGYATRNPGSGGNKLISPNSADATAIYADQWSAATEKITTWNKRNNTKFRSLTTVTRTQFDAVVNGSDDDKKALIATAIAEGAPTADNISVASTSPIILFLTEKGYYGLIEITDASGGISGSTATAGDVRFLTIYQKP